MHAARVLARVRMHAHARLHNTIMSIVVSFVRACTHACMAQPQILRPLLRLESFVVRVECLAGSTINHIQLHGLMSATTCMHQFRQQVVQVRRRPCMPQMTVPRLQGSTPPALQALIDAARTALNRWRLKANVETGASKTAVMVVPAVRRRLPEWRCSGV